MQDRDFEIKCGNTHVYFALKGDDINPQDITDKIGVLPTSCSRKRSAGRYNPSLKFSSWIISSDKGNENSDVEMLIDELIEKLVDKIEIIN